MKKKIVVFLMVISFSSLIPFGRGGSNSHVVIDDWTETETVGDDHLYYNLGSLSRSVRLQITVTSNRSVDLIIMNTSEYYTYDFSGYSTSQAKDINGASLSLDFTTTASVAVWIVIDNTNDVPGGASHVGNASVTTTVDSSSGSNSDINIPGYEVGLLTIVIFATLFLGIRKHRKLNNKL